MNLSFIYTELISNLNSATIRTDDPYEAIKLSIGKNPVKVESGIEPTGFAPDSEYSYISLHFDVIAEWEKGKLHQLEMLHAEGDSHDSDAEYDSPKQMSQSDRDSTYKPPNDVHDSRETAVWP